MGKIDELIQQYCPDGVEYKHLGDICAIKGRIGFRGYTRNDQVKEGEGALSLSPINIKDGRMDYKKGTYITWEKYEESPEIMTYNGDIIFCKTASVGKTALVKDLPYKATINPQLVVLKDIQCNAPFLAYVLEADTIQNKVVSLAGVGSVPNISQKALSDLEIPLPPLPVQEAIVNILDRFAVYTAELQAELQARQQQYNYYRDTLLSFEGREDVEWVKLGEVCIYAKERIGADLMNENNYVSVENLLPNQRGKEKASNVPKEGNCIKFEPNDVLIGNIRPYLHKIWYADCVGGTNGDVLCVRIKDDAKNVIIPRYLYCILSSHSFFEYDNSYSKGAKMPRGDKQKVMEYEFGIPSLSEQQRIVNILDRFDTLVNDLSQGLPAEIEARQQQYEYYRDRLLTFNRK